MRWLYKDLIVYITRNIINEEICGYEKHILLYAIKKFDIRLEK